MNHALQLRLESISGCAVQAIWLVERHGFGLERMVLEPSPGGQLLSLELRGPGGSVAGLKQALKRLRDVKEIVSGPVTEQSNPIEAVAS